MRIITELKAKAMDALRNKTTADSTLYRTIIGEVENAVKTDKKYASADDQGKAQIENDMVLSKLKRFREDLRTTIDQVSSDVASKLQHELQIYDALWDMYAPKLYDEVTTSTIVKEIIAAGHTTIGKIMAEVNKLHKGKVDNNLVRKIADDQLKGQ